MIVLDENIAEVVRQLLKGWRLRARHIGFDIGHSGMKDENEVIPLLHSLAKPVLFTCDQGFYQRQLAHRKYALVYLDVERKTVASYIRRFLRHPSFNTKVKQMGKVVHVKESKIRYWQVGKNQELSIAWKGDSKR